MFGYYAHGVDDTTAVLPAGWEKRLVPLHTENTGGAIGWCLEVHDLASGKLVAGRERDVDFLRVLLRERMVDAALLQSRLRDLPLPPERIEILEDQLQRLATAQ